MRVSACTCVFVCVCMDSTGDAAKRLTDGSIWREAEKDGDNDIEAESRCSDKHLNVLLKVNTSMHVIAPLINLYFQPLFLQLNTFLALTTNIYISVPLVCPVTHLLFHSIGKDLSSQTCSPNCGPFIIPTSQLKSCFGPGGVDAKVAGA